ncbi:ABC transporter permease [Peribacillus asahii]|uniref:ABC transporter permease n=1 Tax=Peribacillus asahii TaxID=228899 RepID=UPI00380BE98A
MNKFWIVLFHTYLMKLKTKSFLITTAIMLLLVIGLSNITKIIALFDDSEEKIGVIDQTGTIFGDVQLGMKAIDEDVELIEFKTEEEAEKLIDSEELTAYLMIKSDEQEIIKGTYKANTLADTTVSSELAVVLSQLKTKIIANELQLTDKQIAALHSPVVLDTVTFEENAKTEEELNQARGLVYIILFIIYMAVIMYSNMIAMEVATEKTSRVMEILISSVSPVQQMFAKILGIALLSLTQMLLFFGGGYWSIKRNLSDMNEGIFSFMGFGSTSMSTIVYAIIFTLLGYFLYATLAACLGSIVSRIEDVQQMITPMIMLVVAAFMLAMFGLNNPSATYITVTSFIPFFAPMIMFLRVGMLDVPFWEISLSIGLLVGSIVILAVFGARVYKGGVLMYGSAKSLKNIRKALQLTKKD